MPENFEDRPAQSINWQQYWKLFQRRRWYFLVPLFIGWTILRGASWMLPPTYRSSTLILVEQPTVPQQYVMPNISGSLQDRVQSITQQILSRTRLLHIIETLNLYASERHNLSGDELVERMRKDIEIELVRAPDREITAFNVYFSARDPKIAQQVTSELTNLFINENLEVRQRQSENTTKFIESQLEEARANLAQQEEKVRQFKDQHLGELPGQLQSNLQILSGLQGQLQSEEDALNRANQHKVYLQSLLGQYRSVQQSAKSGGTVSMGLPAIEEELDKLKSQLADLSAHYTDRHPDVRKIKEQIAKTEKMKQQLTADLKAQAANASDQNTAPGARSESELKSLSPMMELDSQLKANQIEITNRQHSIETLQRRIGEYQARLNQAPVREQQLTELTRGYDQSRANYDSLLKKKNDSELATSLEQQQQGEQFRVLDPPSLPTRPYSPNRVKLSAIGLFLGLCLGGGVTLGAELIDDRIYTEEEFEKLLPADIVSEIPNISSPEEENQTRKSTRLQWAGTGLVLAWIVVGLALSVLRG